MLMTSMSSCRRRGEKWFVAMNKWQDITDMEVSKGALQVIVRLLSASQLVLVESLDMLSEYCRQVECVGCVPASDFIQ